MHPHTLTLPSTAHLETQLPWVDMCCPEKICPSHIPHALLYLEIRSLQRSLSQSQDAIILDLGLVSSEEKGEGDLTHRHRKTWGESHGKMKADGNNTATSPGTPRTRGSHRSPGEKPGTDSHSQLPRRTKRADTLISNSGLQNRERIHLCSVKPPNGLLLLQQP